MGIINGNIILKTVFQETWIFVVVCVLSFFLLFAAYSNHFYNSFHFDDSHVIENNLYIRNLRNIPFFFVDGRTFSSLPRNATYRPLLSVTFALDYWLSGTLEPWQFHVTQFILLALLGIGLVCLFWRLMDLAVVHWWNRYVALYTAVLFCVHTANTETINYISSRSDLLSTLGVIGAFLLYLFLPHWRRFHLYLLPMVLGVLVKTPAVIFAPLLLVFGLLFEQHLSCADLCSTQAWPKVRAAVRHALPAGVVALLLFRFVEAMHPSSVNYGGGARLQYLWTQSFVWLHYVRLFFLPLGLTADTDWTLVPHWYDTRVLAGLLLLALLARCVWVCARTPAMRPVAYGIVWFGLTLLPASSLFPLAEVANEHRIFLPYIGLSLAVVWWLALRLQPWLASQSRLRPVALPMACAVALLVLGGHAVGTYQRHQVWRSEETLWRDVVEKSPANGRAWMNYGLTQMAQGKYAEAKRLFEQAAVYTPNYPYLETNLGIVTDQLGESVLAEQHFLRALQLQPDFVEGHHFYARWLVEQGRAPEAIPHLQRAIALSPGLPASRTLLMHLYFAQGADAALSTLVRETQAILPTDPIALAYANGMLPPHLRVSDPQTYYHHGVMLTQRGQHLDAALVYRQALQFTPESADIYNNCGWSLAKLGFYQASIAMFEQALRLRPGFALAEHNLAWVKTQQMHAP